MESETVAQSISQMINVLVVVDTECIKHAYAPSSNSLAPAIVKSDHLFMTGAGLQNRAGELNFKARIGDVLAMTGTSIDCNSDDAVIVYGVRSVAHGRVLLPFQQRFVTRESAAQPDPDSVSRDGLPALEAVVNFSSFESKIRAHGSERIHVDFALYTLSENGQSQVLFSYCQCDVKIAVGR